MHSENSNPIRPRMYINLYHIKKVHAIAIKLQTTPPTYQL